MPILNDLDNYDYARDKMDQCDNCNKKRKHEVYEGHTFSEGCELWLCTKCGQRTLR